MNDQELADRLYSLVGLCGFDALEAGDNYEYVRSWTVAGAALEKVAQTAEHGLCKILWRLFGGFYHLEMYTGAAYEATEANTDESLPRAINEACCEAPGEDG